jgi:ATP-dependent DNA ligase
MNYYMGIKNTIQNPQYLEELEKTGNFIAEKKMDGIWCSIQTNSVGVITNIVSRHEKEKITKGFIYFIDRNIELSDCILTGELITKNNELHIFDVIKFKNEDTTKYNNEKRREILESLDIYKDKINLVQRWDRDFLKHYNEVINNGGEGLVIKKIGNGTIYIPDTKNSNWYKIKKHMTTDYIITGFDISTSIKYRGQIKAIKLGLYKDGIIKEVCRCGSMKEKDRKYFTDNQKNIIGDVVEIGGYDVFPSGATRHPFFIRLRPDLNKEDANFSKINIVK